MPSTRPSRAKSKTSTIDAIIQPIPLIPLIPSIQFIMVIPEVRVYVVRLWVCRADISRSSPWTRSPVPGDTQRFRRSSRRSNRRPLA